MKKARNKFILFLVTIIFVNVLFFSKVMAQELEIVKIYWFPSLIKTVLYIAEEEGFFREQGIKIEEVKLQNAAEALILLNQGALDVSFSPLSSGMINLIGESKNIRLTAGLARINNNNVGIVMRVRDNFEAPLDTKALLQGLKGKKLGIPILGDLSNYFVEKTLENNGVAIKDIQVVVMPLYSTGIALENGTLDAAHLTEPYITALKNKNKILFIPFSEEFLDAPITFLVYGQNFLVKKPELGVRFMKAYLKGCKQYSEGKTKRNIEIMKKNLQFDEETLKNANWPVVVPELSKLDKLEGYQDWLLEKKYINKKINFQSMLEKKFLERAR